MTFKIILDVNGEPVRTITAWNVGHPKTLDRPEHDDLRRYNYCDDDGKSGYVLHRRGMGATHLAHKILDEIALQEGKQWG